MSPAGEEGIRALFYSEETDRPAILPLEEQRVRGFFRKALKMTAPAIMLAPCARASSMSESAQPSVRSASTSA